MRWPAEFRKKVLQRLCLRLCNNFAVAEKGSEKVLKRLCLRYCAMVRNLHFFPLFCFCLFSQNARRVRGKESEHRSIANTMYAVFGNRNVTLNPSIPQQLAEQYDSRQHKWYW